MKASINILAFSILLSFAGVASAFEPLFCARIDYEIGENLSMIVAADFDGDGDTDMAVSNGPNQNRVVSVYLNNGDMTFQDVTNYEAGWHPYLILAADFDGDGNIDLAATNEEHEDPPGHPWPGYISILLNNGDGTFHGGGGYDAADFPSAFCAADLDGDGDIDLAETDFEYSISILLNNGDGTFQDAVNYAAGGALISIFAADLDGDGYNDLVVVSDWAVSFFFNNGDGTFQDQVDYMTDVYISSIFAADLDGDDDNDLALADLSSDCISVLLNNGDGTFEEPVNFGAGDRPGSLFAADLDGDGDNDLAVANGDDQISVLVNDGDGTFQEAVNYGTGDGPGWILATDFDGDGDNDLAVTNIYRDNASVILNNGDGTFQEAADYEARIEPCSVFGADLDGDGYSDLCVTNAGSDPYNGNISVFLNNGDGTFQEPVDYDAGHYPCSVFAIDLDSDGDNDMAVSNGGTRFYSGSISIFMNNGDGTFQEAVEYPAGGPYLGRIFSADFNGDDYSDLVVTMVASDTGPCFAAILLNVGDGTFQYDAGYLVGDLPSSVFAADLDGDGDNDLAVSNSINDDVSVLINNGDGTFEEDARYDVGGRPTSVFAADLDGDGDADLAVPNDGDYEGSGVVSILLNNGDGTFQGEVRYEAGDTPKSVFAADFDSDGDNDLAVANVNSDNVSILLNNGNSTFQDAVGYGAADGPMSVFAVDVDEDGDYDLAVANHNSDNISILINLSDATGIDDNHERPLPEFFALSQNYPNPFNASTSISFALPEPGDVRLAVYDLLGRQIETLLDGYSPAGTYRVTFNASDYSSGVYFYRIQAGDMVETKRMLLLK